MVKISKLKNVHLHPFTKLSRIYMRNDFKSRIYPPSAILLSKLTAQLIRTAMKVWSYIRIHSNKIRCIWTGTSKRQWINLRSVKTSLRRLVDQTSSSSNSSKHHSELDMIRCLRSNRSAKCSIKTLRSTYAVRKRIVPLVNWRASPRCARLSKEPITGSSLRRPRS